MATLNSSIFYGHLGERSNCYLQGSRHFQNVSDFSSNPVMFHLFLCFLLDFMTQSKKKFLHSSILPSWITCDGFLGHLSPHFGGAVQGLRQRVIFLI